MKPSINLAFIAILFFATSSFAQTSFAPAGSEWYHGMPYGTFHSYSTGDTVIAGITARKIVQKAYTANPWLLLGLRVGDHPDLFVYNNTDTVFVYNHLFSRFTPLYVFNVHAGDTVTLPVLPPEPAYMGAVTDSFFSFVVDSVKMAAYDTATLKTLYTTSIDPGTPHYNYLYGYGLHGYAEKIGTISGGLMPMCQRCTVLATDAIQFQDTVRCYHDAGMSIKMVPGICGQDYSGIAEHTQANEVSAYPLPANDILHIAFPAAVKLAMVTLYDLTGTVLYKGEYHGSGTMGINMHAIATGTYYLKIAASGAPSVVKQVSVIK